jgi:hypothetical protein
VAFTPEHGQFCEVRDVSKTRRQIGLRVYVREIDLLGIAQYKVGSPDHRYLLWHFFDPCKGINISNLVAWEYSTFYNHSTYIIRPFDLKDLPLYLWMEATPYGEDLIRNR